MKKLHTLLLSTGLVGQIVTAQTTGSWGDQGNGTYKNPILESNYPDNAPRSGMMVTEGPILEQADLWLQAKVENGLATFFYSLDGKQFTPLGDEVRLLFSGFTPNLVGFYTMNTEEKGYMDVD